MLYLLAKVKFWRNVTIENVILKLMYAVTLPKMLLFEVTSFVVEVYTTYKITKMQSTKHKTDILYSYKLLVESEQV